MMSPVKKAAERGKFITFEGLDGCGKSTQLEKLATALREQGIDVVTTREPGGTAIGERIRAVLLGSRTAGLDAHAEMALMFASRAQLIAEVILPALESGSGCCATASPIPPRHTRAPGGSSAARAVLRLHRAAVWRTVARSDHPDGFGCGLQRAPRAPAQQGQRSNDENRFEKRATRSSRECAMLSGDCAPRAAARGDD